jgi:hypothetical protein
MEHRWDFTFPLFCFFALYAGLDPHEKYSWYHDFFLYTLTNFTKYALCTVLTRVQPPVCWYWTEFNGKVTFQDGIFHSTDQVIWKHSVLDYIQRMQLSNNWYNNILPTFNWIYLFYVHPFFAPLKQYWDLLSQCHGNLKQNVEEHNTNTKMFLVLEISRHIRYIQSIWQHKFH